MFSWSVPSVRSEDKDSAEEQFGMEKELIVPVLVTGLEGVCVLVLLLQVLVPPAFLELLPNSSFVAAKLTARIIVVVGTHSSLCFEY
jgi:hypothetical protein